VTTTVAPSPDDAAALAAVLAPADVTSDFGGSGGAPSLLSPAQTLAEFDAGAATGRCDPQHTLALQQSPTAAAESAHFESTSPPASALSESGVYSDAATAEAVFADLSADLPCIAGQELGPQATDGVRVSAYGEQAPGVGDESAAMREVITVAGGSIAADADVVLVRIDRTLMLFSFVNTPSPEEHVMLASVSDRLRIRESPG